MSNSCDGGDMCNGQTDNETRLLPIGREYGSGNLILCRECYGVELEFRLNRIVHEGVEQDMPTWESLEVREYNIHDGMTKKETDNE
tara:strand:- start:12 stop:269 length:258 start_codon:yes stop_codon:yes gene_type:complete